MKSCRNQGWEGKHEKAISALDHCLDGSYTKTS